MSTSTSRRWPPSVPTAAAATLLCAFVALSFAYNAVVPPFEGADESAHYFVAQHIARTGALPVQREKAADRGPWEQEGSQPPLYYALAAPLIRLARAENDGEALRVNDQNSMGRPAVAGNENRFVHDPAREGWPWRGEALAVHLGRALSTLLGLLTLIALGSIFARVFPGRGWLGVAALALVALNPQFIHLSSTVSNDNAMNALAAASLALFLPVIDSGGNAARTRFARRRDAAGLALAVGLAPLAKITGLSLAAFVVAALLWTARRRHVASEPDQARRLVATAAAVVVACLVLSGWWYARNIRLYGSLTGLNIMLPPELRRDWNVDRFLRGLPGELNGLWLSSWGIFGWFTILLPTWVYRLINAAALASLAGGLLAWRRRRTPSLGTPPPELGEREPKRAIRRVWGPVSASEARRGRGPSSANPLRPPSHHLAALALWWLIAFASLLRWMLIAKGAHGRLLFPAIAAPAALLVLGWRSVLPTRRASDRALALAVAGAMAALSTGALVGVIRPAYAQPATIAASALPADAVPIGVVFDGAVELVAMTAPARAIEGSEVDVTLYWRVVGPVERDGYVALGFGQDSPRSMLTGERSTAPSSEPALGYPGGGSLPFDLFPRGDRLVVDRRRVAAPTLATYPDWDGYRPSALARLAVDVYDMAAHESWPSAPASAGGPDVAFVDVALDAAPPQPDDDERLAASRPGPVARFGDVIDLDVRTFEGDGPPVVPRLPMALVRTAPVVTGTLQLVWRARAAPIEDYQMFIHLVDARTADVLALDGPVARHAHYPTSRWREGDRLPFRFDWASPTPAKPGDRYTLRIGLYSLAAGNPRVPAVDAAGRRWPDDAVPVAEITVR